VSKERAIRRRKLKALWARLKELKEQRPSVAALLMKLGAAKAEAGRVWSLVEVTLPEVPHSKKARQQRVADFEFSLKKDKLREVLKREGRYLKGLPSSRFKSEEGLGPERPNGRGRSGGP
jgi:hypothetical protein